MNTSLASEPPMSRPMRRSMPICGIMYVSRNLSLSRACLSRQAAKPCSRPLRNHQRHNNHPSTTRTPKVESMLLCAFAAQSILVTWTAQLAGVATTCAPAMRLLGRSPIAAAVPPLVVARCPKLSPSVHHKVDRTHHGRGPFA
eukprot:scaffold4383_cov92-Isochrysis_galbana.AAC.2